MNIVITVSGTCAEEKAAIAIYVAHALRSAGFGVSSPVELKSSELIPVSIADMVALDTLIDVEFEADAKDTIPCPPSFQPVVEPCVSCGTKEKVTFAPDPYLSDLRNDQTPVHMCEHCRELAAREL